VLNHPDGRRCPSSVQIRQLGLGRAQQLGSRFVIALVVVGTRVDALVRASIFTAAVTLGYRGSRRSG
jgi:hypothetical protein